MLVSRIIREHIEAAKDTSDATIDKKYDEEDDVKGLQNFGNIYLGSPEKKMSFNAVQKQNSGKQLFAHLQARSTSRIKQLLHRTDSPVKAKLEDIASAVAAIDNSSIVSITALISNGTHYGHIYHR